MSTGKHVVNLFIETARDLLWWEVPTPGGCLEEVLNYSLQLPPPQARGGCATLQGPNSSQLLQNTGQIGSAELGNQGSSNSPGGWRTQAWHPSLGTGQARAGKPVDTSTRQTETQNQTQLASDTCKQSSCGEVRAGSGLEDHSLCFTDENTKI